MPRQGGALNANGIGSDAGQDLKVAKVLVFANLPGLRHHALKAAKEGLRLIEGLALDSDRHEGGAGRADGATGPFKGDFFYPSVPGSQGDGDTVSAERVVAFSQTCWMIEPSFVSGTAIVIQDHILIKLSQIGCQANISRTLLTP